MDEIKFEIEHLKQGQKRHEERISLLEKSDVQDNERFARMETESIHRIYFNKEVGHDYTRSGKSWGQPRNKCPY